MKSTQEVRIQAFKDAIEIVESRKQAMGGFGPAVKPHPGVLAAFDECLVFLRGELDRCERGVSIPGSPGSRSDLM